jgi:SH3-like domain-containing protein
MENPEFKRLIYCFGLIAEILFVLSSCRSSNEKNLQTEIDQVAAQWVPDHRVGICNIKLRSLTKGTLILTGETTNPDAKNAIIKTLYNKCKILIDSVLLLPDTTKNQKFMGLVTMSVINLRKKPDHTSELVSQVRLGTPVLILKIINSWIQIQTPDNYISWTEETSVKRLNTTEMTIWKKSSKVIYLETTGWLHDTPSDKSGVVGDLVAGSIMEKTGELKGFTSVVLPDGRKGFVENKKIEDFGNWKSNINYSEENICNVARTFLGVPYLWGGSSIKGVDCSGFVQSVFFMNGLILARDASLQALHGTPVDVTDGYIKLRKGDLLFFGSKENKTLNVTHVAIYLGNSEYINASGRVMINSLDSTQVSFNRRRTSSLLEAKRISGVVNDMGIVPVIKHPWY